MSETYSDLSESKFPEKIDYISRMGNLAISDLNLVNEYYDLYNSGDIDSANELLQNTQLESKIFNAAKFNKLADSIMAVQHFFRDEVDGYIDNTKTELQKYVDNFTDTGEYSSTKKYFKRNIVSYLGCGYICKKDCVGIAPVQNQSTEYWGFLVRGIKGDSGLGLTPRGKWEKDSLYYVDDWVYHENCVWECKIENMDSKPMNGNENWIRIMSLLPSKGFTWGDLAGINGGA